MTRLLLEKGAALIRSFRGRSQNWNDGHGLGQHPAAAITCRNCQATRHPISNSNRRKSGIAVAHSDPELIGKEYEASFALSPAEESDKVQMAPGPGDQSGHFCLRGIQAIQTYQRHAMAGAVCVTTA